MAISDFDKIIPAAWAEIELVLSHQTNPSEKCVT